MSFSLSIKDQAYERAGGRCEYCGRPCRRIPNGDYYEYPDSEFHHRKAQSEGGDDSLSNCVHLCTSCHEKTASYGRH